MKVKKSLAGGDHQVRLSPHLGFGKLSPGLGIFGGEQCGHDIVPLTHLPLGRHTLLRILCGYLEEPLAFICHLWEYPFVGTVPSVGVDVEEGGASEA